MGKSILIKGSEWTQTSTITKRTLYKTVYRGVYTSAVLNDSVQHLITAKMNTINTSSQTTDHARITLHFE